MSDTVRMVGPDSQQVYAVPSGQEEAYAKAGYTRYAGLAVDEGTIAQRVQSWRDQALDTAEATGLGAVDAFPLANTAINTFAPASVRQKYFEELAAEQERHPTAFKIGSAIGTVGGFAAAEGLGALALGRAAAAGLGGAEALGSFASAQPFAAGVLRNTLTSAAVGTAQQYDEAATRHALDPAGTEKMAFSYGHLALDTLLGAAGGAVGGAVSRIGRLGGRIATAGENRMANAILDETAVANLQQQGKQEAVAYVRGLAGNPEGKTGVIRKIAEDLDFDVKEMNAVQTALGKNRATYEEVQGMVDKVMEVAGAEDNPARLIIRPYAERLEQAAALHAEGKAKAANKLMPTIHDLKKTYEKLYKEVYWPNVAAHPHSATFRAAGEAVSETANAMTGRVLGPEQAARLVKAKTGYANRLAITEVMSKDELQTLGQTFNKAAQGAAFAAMMAGVGAIPGTVLGAGGKGLFYSTVFNLNAYSTGQAVRGLGRVIGKADKAVTHAVTAGLIRTAQVAAHEAILGHDYQDLASKVEAAARNPLASSAANHEALIKAGVPEQAADKIALTNRAIFQAAEENRPKRQGAADMVTQQQPDPVAQRKWVSWVRSAQDPTYALRYPTKANLDAARRFSPQVMQTVEGAVHEQVAKNPELGLRAKMWSSKVLGRPTSNIASPTFFQSLRQQRAAAEAQAQQQAQPQRSAGGANRLQSEQTRLGELSGG